MGGDSRNLANYTLIFRPIYKGGVIGYTVASLYRSSLPQLPFAHTHCAKLQKRSLTSKRSEVENIFLPLSGHFHTLWYRKFYGSLPKQ